jgi:hypothetical protein
MRGTLFPICTQEEECKRLPILAFKGTSGFVTDSEGDVPSSTLTDIRQSLEHTFGSDVEYFRQVEAIVMQLNQLDDFEFLVADYSLGGLLASAVSRLTGRPAFTFNAAGLNPDLLRMSLSSSIITHYTVNGEILISVQKEVNDLKRRGKFRPLVEDLQVITNSLQTRGLELNVLQKCRDGPKKFIWLIVHTPFQPVLEKSTEIEV